MKRHQPVLRWLAFLLLLASAARCAQIERFVCPRNCSCIPEGHEEYELSCPGEHRTEITIQLKSHSKAIIQCQVYTDPDDYSLLKDVYIDAGTLLYFERCPLPDVPFTDILQLRYPAKIQTFTFKSYRNFNDTLERRLFKGLTGITTLTLSNNGLTTLPNDLLMDLPHLQHLYLLSNLIQLPSDLFQPVLSLETLDLGKNEITNIPIDLFRNLRKLTLLNLWKNKLSNLAPEMFIDLTSLESLDLRHNGLTSLPADIFKYLKNLKNLSLTGNNFKNLPVGLFNNNKNLVTVQLSDSRESNFNLPTGLFSNLPNLTTVDLNNDGLKAIPEDIFWGSTNLRIINLKNNHLKEIPSQLLQQAVELEKLDLRSNYINSLPDNLFIQCKKLKFLDLSSNQIMNLSLYAFTGLDSLEELNMQNNGLRHVHINAFPSTCKLKVLNWANNKLSFLDQEGYTEGGPRIHSEFGDNSPLKSCIHLTKIDLFNNSIPFIFADWRLTMPQLNFLNLSHNALQAVHLLSDAFVPPHNRVIDIRHNKISEVDLNGAEAWALLQQKDPYSQRSRWLLDGNPLACNCSNYDFLRYLNKEIAAEVLQIIDFDPGNMACATPEKWKDEPVLKVSSRAVTCPLTSLNETLACPYPCECAFRPADDAVIVDCIGKNLTVAPAELPTHSQSNHTELYLTHNRLNLLPDFTFPGYQMISKLAAGHNNITSLHNIKTMPPIMQIIELNHNNLTVMEMQATEVFYNLTNLTNIALHNNPWKCDCQLQPLVSFVQNRYQQISSPKEIKCTDGQLLTELTASGLCSQASSVVWASLVIALLLGVLIGGAFAMYYRFNNEIKAWLFAHNLCLWFVTEEELDKDKLYDAFVSYSHKDEDFVVNELVAGLEGGPIPFKLCLHYRDWIAGEWIPNQITRSVEESRRTLVVLSPNFLESVWGRMEFRAAHCQAMSEGRARVIIVLLGDIGSTEDLDPELRAYLNMNTYLKWGDPWFWNKLRYALPHPPKAMKGSMGLVNPESNVTDPLTIKNALNEVISAPRKVPIPSHGTNGTAAAVG
ncbi:Protein toll [Frankliniella fusca]|uniref:Protein toll n=1 Tax=Frankliniella fusca TaxID=407009 RepID=A0AAE1HNY3_9NEOP|nr:Protein toll [Frankliniella fusca]